MITAIMFKKNNPNPEGVTG